MVDVRKDSESIVVIKRKFLCVIRLWQQKPHEMTGNTCNFTMTLVEIN